MRYIDSNVIINDVKNRMSKYFSSQKVDESILPRVIRKCVGKMGLKVYPEKRAVLEVCDYKAILPDGFRYLALAMLCSGKVKYVKNQLKTRQDQLICENPCSTVCVSTEVNAGGQSYGSHSVMTDSCGNILKIIETTELDRFESQELYVLRASPSSKPWCSSGCPNLRTKNPYEFEIKDTSRGKIIQTNVCDGKLYIEYLTDIEHEDSFDIPDNETVKDWIFEELRKEIYTHLWDNGDAEVQGRMQHSEREVQVKHAMARQVYSQKGIQERYDTANRLINRFKAMENWMSPGNGYYCPR
jgi:hypothetical protein